MTYDSEHTRIVAHHEAAHGTMAWILARPIGLLSIRPGAHYEGVATHRRGHWPDQETLLRLESRPVVLWPALDRRALEVDVCIALAGALGEQLVDPWTPDPLSTFHPDEDPDEVKAKRAAEALAGQVRSAS